MENIIMDEPMPINSGESVHYEMRNSVEVEPGVFECEVLHPIKGWLPYSCVPNDSDPDAQMRYAHMLSSKNFRQMTDEERTARIEAKLIWATESIRNERTRLLAETDYITAPDVWPGLTTEKQSAWVSYRAALRDIPQQTGFPETIDWPIKP